MEAGYLMAGSDFCEGYAGVRWAVGRDRQSVGVCSHSFRSRPTRARWDRRATGDRRREGRRLDPFGLPGG